MTLAARFDPAPRGLQGVLAAPADKSVSHRAAILGAACEGTLEITNYLRAADTDATLDAVRALGAGVELDGSEVTICGVGLRGAREPAGVIDVRNSGTLLRLLPGWLAGQEGRHFTLDGDDSIRRRPIDRIAEPLRAMGAQIEADRLPPFTVHGVALHGATYAMPVASAQVKSCILLAGLLADGETTVIEPQPSRDHTERMWLRAGVTVIRKGSRITVSPSSLASIDRVVVPGDPSSAAFWVAAATLVAGSHVIVEGVGANWTRNGFVQIARRMGASVAGEIEAEIRAAGLHGTTVEADEVPLAIDELPLVALLGAFAEGETVVRGAQELRVKETDRIATVVGGLEALGAQIEATADGFVVTGTGGLRGGAISSHGDHRLAMLGAIAGLASRHGVEVDGIEAAHVSYPAFTADLARLAT